MLPLSLNKNLSKKLSEHKLNIIKQKHNLYSLCDVLAFKMINSLCSKFLHYKTSLGNVFFPRMFSWKLTLTEVKRVTV